MTTKMTRDEAFTWVVNELLVGNHDTSRQVNFLRSEGVRSSDVDAVIRDAHSRVKAERNRAERSAYEAQVREHRAWEDELVAMARRRLERGYLASEVVEEIAGNELPWPQVQGLVARAESALASEKRAASLRAAAQSAKRTRERQAAAETARAAAVAKVVSNELASVAETAAATAAARAVQQAVSTRGAFPMAPRRQF